MKSEIETKVNELAEQVIPAAMLESFLALDLNAKLTGIAVFAHLAGDKNMMSVALAALKNI
jgi:hypothetical protein